MMSEQALPVGVIILTLMIVWTNARWTTDDEDFNLHSIDKSVIRRYFVDRYLSFKHRQTAVFTEAQRKFQNEALQAHNTLRARHCVEPLILDDSINTRAQAYAERLASNDSKLIHSTDRGGLLGENLFAVTRTNPITYPDANKATQVWYSEVAHYDYDKPGYAPNIAHFSQVVWKNSQRFGTGYAFARNGYKMYAVAMYGPPGNYGFAYSENVLQPKC